MSVIRTSIVLALFRAMLIAVLLPALSVAQQAPRSADLQAANGDLAAREPLLDPVFGFAVRALGLRRSVQMWQWSAATEIGATAARYTSQLSEERRVGAELVLTRRSRCSPYNSKKNRQN